MFLSPCKMLMNLNKSGEALQKLAAMSWSDEIQQIREQQTGSKRSSSRKSLQMRSVMHWSVGRRGSERQGYEQVQDTTQPWPSALVKPLIRPLAKGSSGFQETSLVFEERSDWYCDTTQVWFYRIEVITWRDCRSSVAAWEESDVWKIQVSCSRWKHFHED